ncbi:MAG: RusA family crossover junction endodeoxyribonuclease [Sedimentisphaeraceae bacterium JB056]
MNKAINLTLPWPPSVNHYYRKVGSRMLISRRGRIYRQAVCFIVRELGIKTFDCELKITIDAYPPDRRRRDGDNLLKAIFDSLQHGGLFQDDSQIKDFEFYTKELERPDGKITVRLTER